MWRPLWLLSFFLVFVSCGKNDAIRPVGYAPYAGPFTQAPPPPQGGGWMPPQGPGGMPPGGPGYFTPQPPPPQYGPGFYPFMPIYQYMQQRPQLNVYWINIWNDWRGYAQNNGCQQTDFSCFWRDYCPNQLGNSSFAPIHQAFDQNVYYWVGGDTQFLPGVDASYFWQPYNYMPYSEIDISIGW